MMRTEFSNPNAFNYNQIRPTKNTKSKNQTQEKQGETTKAISSKNPNQVIKIIKH
ncbi:hypothetical protein [Helicobacter pylori]|uniref:hypothetical protein n=2 Tax=Helicobacter pylori TaxID=210 RepID=UPI0015F289E3|nr:hypothetical protein [Helicobacter pylori]MBH0233211.1 hypothetical protein [Helicobacter pylori]WQT01115.1 hypothetical protein E5D88_06795 [Helicobacter pylori]WQT18460.1 hypothetical protein FNE54_06785 [Helicobacter pylori]WQT51387.1 hypothetical protein KVC77_06805 [Helicobacter pylori]WQU35610.1 hypothetical protein KVC86_06775 [Helicobacter pylori]